MEVTPMPKRAVAAVKWIVGILHAHAIEYQIAGGFAAKIYGSPRELNDIDVDIREKDFATILPDISPYVISGPLRFNDGKFDCEWINLKYHDQEIDISGTDTLRMSNKERTEWITYPNFTFDTLDVDLEGTTIKVVHPRKLVAYKKELDGPHQLLDIEAAEKYLRQISKVS